MSNDSSHALEGCYDIFALPADKRFPKGIFFYTANGHEIRGYAQDQNEKVSFDWSHGAGGRKAGSIRVVDSLRGFRDGPDENPTTAAPVLEDVAWVVYAGCETSTGQEILVLANSVKEEGAYVAAPWPPFRGIGVDRGYLWVYRAGDIACATHTSIRKAVKEHRQPSWMTYKGFPKEVVKELSLDDKHLTGLVDLCPCDDGTLVAGFVEGNWSVSTGNELKMFMLTPRIDRQKKQLAFNFVPIRGMAFRVWKQPLFCWTLLEETTATLEEQTAIPAKRVRSLLRDVVAPLETQNAPPAR